MLSGTKERVFYPVRVSPIVIDLSFSRTLTATLVLTALLIPASAGATWRDQPPVPEIEGELKTRFERDVARSDRLGMRATVFAKVGDSNSEVASALYGLGCRTPRLAGRFWLKPALRRFNQTELPAGPPGRAMPGCEPITSFSRRSNAARSASFSTWSLQKIEELAKVPLWSPPPGCGGSETPLSCEIRDIRPRFTLIMTGSNDRNIDNSYGLPLGSQTTERMIALVREVRRLGSVPVLSTLPPRRTPDAAPDEIAPTNAAISRAAKLTRTPLINLWAALARPSVVNQGLDPEGLHLSVSPGTSTPMLMPEPTTFADSVDFRPAALRYGANVRNLIWLKSLARLDRVASRP